MIARAATFHLPDDLRVECDRALDAWDRSEGTKRLFARDAGLWTAGDEAEWLGWLDLPGQEREQASVLTEWQRAAAEEGVSSVVVLGMGGSSLAADVWRHAFGKLPGHPKLLVLDSTDPAQVRAVDEHVDPADAWYVVASKSGSTLEPNLFEAYFFERAQARLGSAEAGRRFFAITDPGSSLERLAGERRYRHVFSGVRSVGGRYSALSHFGMVPAALMGLDVSQLLDRAEVMRNACAAHTPAAENPGVSLGVTLGVLAARGIDKLTLVASPGIRDLGAWLEQLIAESTGKGGKGIIPVDRERVAAAARYGGDRVFAYLRLDEHADPEQERAIEALESAGRPVLRLPLAERYDLAAEMYRWEIATAVAGALLRIHPFDQPDVEASKLATRALTDDYERRGALPAESPLREASGIRVFAGGRHAAALARHGTLADTLREHFDRLGPGDYFAVLAYMEMTAEHEESLQAIRHLVRDARGVATCLGFGPRFLHSTGQAYKGGPNTGIFLQITTEDADDIAVPGRRATFGVVKAAQARGDFAVLAERERRAMRVHLGAPAAAGLQVLIEAVREALGS